MEQTETQKLFEQMAALWVEFAIEQEKSSKVVHRNARKALNALKKLMTPYNKASVTEDKA